MLLDPLKISHPQGEYPIFIKSGLINDLGENLKKLHNNRKLALITDNNVFNIYGEKIINNLSTDGYEIKTIKIKPGENSKSLDNLNYIYNELVEYNLTKSDLIVTLGGGVIGDLGGFAASTFLRGIPYVQVPTTLLSQVDSSVGGKVAINLPKGKNLVGSFYHPKGVYIDPEVLNTLDKRYFYDGMAEVIKYGCIRDKNLFYKLLSYNDKNELFDDMGKIIYTCCKIKSDIVKVDERDKGLRMILNFGHTIGHGIEKIFDYEGYTHGEGVAIGMYNITKKSEEMGITAQNTSQKIMEILKKYNLPYSMPKLDYNKLIDSIYLDKKSRGDMINLILLKEIGDGFIYPINKGKIDKFIY